MEQNFSSYLWSGVFWWWVPAKITWADSTIPKKEGGIDLSEVSDWYKAGVMRFIWNLFVNTDFIRVAWTHACMLRGRCFWLIAIPNNFSWGGERFCRLGVKQGIC